MKLQQPLACFVGVVAIIVTVWATASFAEKRRLIQNAEAELLLIAEAQDAIYDSFRTYSLSSEQKSATEILQFMSTRMNNGPIFLKLWQGESEQPRDPWEREYCMEETGDDEAPFFYSAGPNGLDEGIIVRHCLTHPYRKGSSTLVCVKGNMLVDSLGYFRGRLFGRSWQMFRLFLCAGVLSVKRQKATRRHIQALKAS